MPKIRIPGIKTSKNINISFYIAIQYLGMTLPESGEPKNRVVTVLIVSTLGVLSKQVFRLHINLSLICKRDIRLDMLIFVLLYALFYNCLATNFMCLPFFLIHIISVISTRKYELLFSMVHVSVVYRAVIP